jgi:hypothetical protein
MSYSVVRINGKVESIAYGNTSIPLVPGNSDYDRFLKWQDAQPEDQKLDLSDHEPEPLPLADRRKQEYEKRGVTSEALVVALWESVIENRPEAAASLQEIRNQVKVSIPKGK